jgi:hypothetical protein
MVRSGRVRVGVELENGGKQWRSVHDEVGDKTQIFPPMFLKKQRKNVCESMAKLCDYYYAMVQ